MNPILIRFAGLPDGVVRRQARKAALGMRVGTTKRFVFGGYLVSIAAGPSTTVANIIELGVECVALSGVLLLVDQRNSFVNVRRVPTVARLKDGGGPLPVGQDYDPGDSQVIDLNDVGSAGFPYWNRRFVRSGFGWRGIVSELLYPRDYAAKAEVQRWGVVHAVCVPDFQDGANVQEDFPHSPWYAYAKNIRSALELVYWSQRGGRAVYISDEWLADKLNDTLLFSSAGNHYGSPGIGITAPAPAWWVVGDTSFPRLFDNPDDALIPGSNEFPHKVTRDTITTYRQSCYPAVYADAQRMLVAAPCLRGDDSVYQLYAELVEDGVARQGYVSTRSVMYNTAEIGSSLQPAAGEPCLALLWFEQEPVTEDEARGVYAVGARTVARMTTRRGSSDPAEVGDSAPQWLGGQVVSIGELPVWYHPGTLAARTDQLIATLGDGAEAYVPRVLSNQKLPSAFGAAYATDVAGLVEVAFAVKSLEPAQVPITAGRRATPLGEGYPDQAAILVAKVGIVTVMVDSATPGLPTITTRFEDVIGPTDCAQFSGAFDPDVAYLPQVRFGCTLGTQRVYAVRAVRYARNEFLASALSMVGVGVPRSYTVDYTGAENSSIGGPVFYTDREFGPYPDEAKYEELWFVVDGVRHVVDTAALGGYLEPFTEGKWGNGMLQAFSGWSDAENPHYRQIMGMGIYGMGGAENYDRLDFYAEEFITRGGELQTFVKVSETDVMFVLSKKRTPLGQEGVVVCRYSSVTHQAVAVYTGLPEPITSTIVYPALTCYQQEVVDEGGIVQAHPHLVLRLGRETGGSVFTSVDGGVSWQLLYDQTSTEQYNALGEARVRDGTPGLGLHVLGRIGWQSDPHNLLYKEAGDE